MDQVFSPESFITIHKYSKKEKNISFPNYECTYTL